MPPRRSDDSLPHARAHPYPAFRTALGEWIDRARRAAGMTHGQLAAATGVSVDRLSRMVLGSADAVAVWEIFLLCQELGPSAPPIPFAPAPSTDRELMRLARAVKPDEREALVVSCYSTVEGARIDAQYARDHDEWPLVVPDKLVAKLHRRGLVWQLERFETEDDEPDVNRAICVRTYTGNAVAEVLGREMF